MIVLADVKKNREFATMIDAANNALEVLGYTEHGLRHVGYVSHTAADILRSLDYSQREVELAEIAGWLHDVGNLINRVNHGITGAAMVLPILINMGMPMQEATVISVAIGNHEEQVGKPINAVGAAVIIADKIDAHRSRVRKGAYNPKDIHDRVNYSIKENKLTVSKEKKTISFEITMDDNSSAMDYFRIYLARMVFAESAAAFLGCRFLLYMNGMLLNTAVNSPAISGGSDEVNSSF